MDRYAAYILSSSSTDSGLLSRLFCKPPKGLETDDEQLFQNVFSPLRDIPSPLLNKLSHWPLTIATLKGTSHHFTHDLHQKYGRIVVLSPGIISVADAGEIKRIIKAEDWSKSHAIYGNFRQDPERPTLLAFTDKKAYGRRKRLMSAMFGIKCIRNMEPLMRGCVAVAVRELDRACDGARTGSGVEAGTHTGAGAGAGAGAVVDMQHLVHGLAIDIIGVTTFGQSFHVVENGSHPLPTRLKQGLKLAAWMMLIPWIRKVPMLPTRDPYIDQFTRGIVEGRRREVASEGAEAKADLLQWLVKMSSTDVGSEFRTSDVQDESVVLLTAGSETTANAELFTLLLLAKHPAALERLYQEVDEWYPANSDRKTDCAYSLTGMIYLQACINEAMRMVPGQATGSPRETSRDETVLGYRLPKGTTVFPNTQESHTDPQLWHQPHRFSPERWLDGAVDEAALPFWPFSAGSRVCIGKHFALQEMHLTLVTLLRYFFFEHIPGQDETTVFRVAQQLRAEAYWMRVSRRRAVKGGEDV